MATELLQGSQLQGTIPINTMGFQSFGAMFQRKSGNVDVPQETNELEVLPGKPLLVWHSTGERAKKVSSER